MAAGDIDGPLDDWEYDTNHGSYSRMTHIAGDVYAITYGSNSFPGGAKIRTVNISKDGTINGTISGPVDISSTGIPLHSSLINVANDVYVIASANVAGYIRTIRISDDGTQIDLIDTHTFDSQYGGWATILHLTGEIYVVTCHGQNGWYMNVYTIRIQSNGTIVQNEDFYRFTYVPTAQNAIKITDSIVALFYESGGSSIIRTIGIQPDGTITGLINSRAYGSVWQYIDAMNISEDIYAIGYSRGNSTLIVDTITISSSGIIGPIISTSTIGQSTESSFIHCGGNIYAMVYRKLGAPNDNAGYITSIEIEPNGTVHVPIQTVSYGYCSDPCIVHGARSLCPVTYTGHDHDLTIKTFAIDAPSGIIHPPRFTTGLSHRSFH